MIFSNFGGLNCADSGKIQNIAKAASKILRPGGKFIAVVMGRKCLLENTYFLFRNKKLVNRRKSQSAVIATVSDVSFPVWYYSPNEFIKLAQPWLSKPAIKPIGLFTPPSFLDKHFSKLKVLVSGAGLLENLSPALSGLSDYADHYLIEFTKP